MSNFYLRNKPEKTEFTRLFEDKSEELKVEVCGVTNTVTIIQYDTEKLYQLDEKAVKWLVGILNDSLQLINTNE